MGIIYFYWNVQLHVFIWPIALVSGSFSIVLNILLMVLIVIRLGLHRRDVRKVMGGAAGAGGLYKAIISILIESFSLYVINFLLYFGPWVANDGVWIMFLPILHQTHVRFPFLFCFPHLQNTCLIAVVNRSSLLSLSFYESPI